MGYESAAQGALQPGETRTVSLAGVPADATSALVLVTTREATKKGEVRIGTPDKSATAMARMEASLELLCHIVLQAGVVFAAHEFDQFLVG